LGLRLALGNAAREKALNDGKADVLDAMLCMVQAAWGLQQHQNGHQPTDYRPLTHWKLGSSVLE
jgi:hypothetical protein